MPTPLATELPSLRRREIQTGFDYATHIAQVKERLNRLNFGPTIDMLTPEGINRPNYISWARGKLLGPNYVDSLEQKELPRKIGEVELPPNLRKRAGDISAELISMNVGYGHLRPALAMQNMLEVLGAETKSIFLGGDQEYFRPMNIPSVGNNESLDKLIRTVTGKYTYKSLETAYRQGLIHEKPDELVEDPAYVHKVERLLGILANPVIYFKNRDQLLASIFGLTTERTDRQKRLSGVALRMLASQAFANLIEDNKANPDKKDQLVISTHGIVSQAIGSIPTRVKERLQYEDANFQPDVAMLYDTHTYRPTTYTERPETSEKWAYKQGRGGEFARNTVVMDGYITPLSIFNRTELTLKRRDAALAGEPLTVIATASGIAPAQLGAFKEFIHSQKENLINGKLHMVIECGAQEGGGLLVMHDLEQILRDNQLGEAITLHASATPEASLQFFEALTWSEKPLAMLVKGSEMTRIAQALNIPLISVGALGDHEWWNIASTMLDNPESIMFAQKTGDVARKDIQRIFPNDILVKHHPEREYVPRLLSVLEERTTDNPDQILAFAKSYIASGKMSFSRPDAMLNLVEDMLVRKDIKEARKRKRRS